MTERSLLKASERHLQSIPGLAYRKRHGSPFSVAGDPDLYICWYGKHFEIELKRPGESPTLLQRARLAEWEKAGAVTAVVHSVEELKTFLHYLERRLIHQP